MLEINYRVPQFETFIGLKQSKTTERQNVQNVLGHLLVQGHVGTYKQIANYLQQYI